MERLAAVKFNNVGKFYYFSTTLDLHKGDKVVVETIRGLELGEMISELKDISEFKLNAELKPIKRKANRADVEVYSINKIKAEKSFEICKDIIEKSGLDMRLINCEYTLDASKVIFMYTADERVDFRELLKKLASVFKCRIELRQVGPRDKAKIVGGLGTCGMPLCCNSFLGEFDGVSINMAKNQLLAINIDKISGACGRLLCCLKYEDEAYTDLKKKFPRIGTRTTFEGHHVKVTGLNVISGLVKFIDEDNSVRFVSLEEFNKNQGKEKREHRPPREEKKATNEEKGHAKKQSKQEKPFKKKPNKRKPHNKQNRNRKKENVKNESRSH
ncbi:PSP1 domain-containing protein [Kandleria vitulina]|jgi:cell fate regulator YaaT (PSP1 superfamily)|uniref:PSP1 domain-containing protein n=1 Tax=Kandleria vitulina TaxID=1630 RepID=UPI00049004F9|nr:stage 0 sporulation family protein [Kandleria vitulina]